VDRYQGFVAKQILSGMNLDDGKLFPYGFCFATLPIPKGVQSFGCVLLWLGQQNFMYD